MGRGEGGVAARAPGQRAQPVRLDRHLQLLHPAGRRHGATGRPGRRSVLDHLGEISVQQAEWVLFTHHRCEPCRGAAKLAACRPQLAARESERALFEELIRFRNFERTLGDAFTVHGASYVRPPLEPVRPDRTFKDLDVFTWRGRDFRRLDTKGNSPGRMSYLLKFESRWAFTGDVMLDRAKPRGQWPWHSPRSDRHVR